MNSKIDVAPDTNVKPDRGISGVNTGLWERKHYSRSDIVVAKARGTVMVPNMRVSSSFERQADETFCR